MKRTRLVFFGTSDFAVPSLERLAGDERFEVAAVVTQPDRPAGRHAESHPPPVKVAAERLGLPLLQFEKVKSDEAFEALKQIGVETAVVASYGQIIPQHLLDLYPRGMINVHGSLLPKYRGASPIQAAIREGETETGITIMLMDALMDHGPTLAFATEPIHSDDTGGSLHDRLALLGAKTLPDVLFDDLNGLIEAVPQDHAKASAVKLLAREDGLIDWTQPATVIERMVRAYDPWPGTYTMEDGKRLKILGTKLGAIDGMPVKICGDGQSLTLLRVQPEGKRPMDGSDFLRGHRTST